MATSPAAAGSHDTSDRRGLVVALDGPASSGKSSVGAAAAARLGYRFCDTGLLYRAVTWLALRRGVPAEDVPRLVGLVREVQLLDIGDGRLAHVSVSGVDVTDEVHGPEVDAAVSAVSRLPELRAELMERQRSLVDGGRIIMAGRDIGTVVLPDADLKLFLDASLEERARRRIEERGVAEDGTEAAEIERELRRRDSLDTNRPVAPLRAADDAIVIQTDGNTLDMTIDLVVEAIRGHDPMATRVDSPAATTSAEPASGAIPVAPMATAAREPERAPRVRRPPAKPTKIIGKVTWFPWLAAGILRLLARTILRLRVEGDPDAVPRTGAVIVAGNHASSADPVLIGAFLNARLGRCVNWLGKRELVEIPVIGPFMRMVPIHPVDREAADLDAFRTAIRILESGNILGIFPEGTRSVDGALKPVREGAGVLALHSGATIMPVAIVDSDLAWPKGHLVPRFRKAVTVRWGTPFRVQDEVPGIAAMSRKEANAAATRLIMTRIAELLPPRQRGVYAADVSAAAARSAASS